LIPPRAYYRIGQQLFKDGIVFLHEMATDDSLHLASWHDARESHQLQGPIRAWYAAILYHLCQAVDDDNRNSSFPAENNAISLQDSPILAPLLLSVAAHLVTDSESEDEWLIDPQIRRQTMPTVLVTVTALQQTHRRM
jgi:hypothetical protein